MNDTATPSTPTVTLGQTENVCEAIVNEVADAEGVSPLDVEPPLYSVIDADALEQFVDSLDRSTGPGHIEFRYGDYDVTVTAGGDVRVTEV